ncbi:hypothetical protein PG985_008504 [Apiospora marii]|uniref:uncharacterized protein n=1 Tax=Apiospora marii TaxID=335849 RepID=UPI003131CFC9
MSSNTLTLTAAQRDHIKAAWDNMSRLVMDMILGNAVDHWEHYNRHDEVYNGEDSDDEVSIEAGSSNPVLDGEASRGKLTTRDANYHGTWELQEISPDDTHATIAFALSWQMCPDNKEDLQNRILGGIVTQDVPASLVKFTWSSCDRPLTTAQQEHIQTVWDSGSMKERMHIYLRAFALAHWNVSHGADEIHEWGDQDLNFATREFISLGADYQAWWELLATGPDDTHATIAITHSWEMDEERKALLERAIPKELSNKDVSESLIKVIYIKCGSPREIENI